MFFNILGIFCQDFGQLNQIFPTMIRFGERCGASINKVTLNTTGEIDLEQVLKLSAYPNVAIKLTGACTLSHQGFPYRDIWQPLERLIEAYGVKRCLWGTDWTRAVALLSYAEGVDAFRQMSFISKSDRAMLMGGAAAEIYNWTPAQ